MPAGASAGSSIRGTAAPARARTSRCSRRSAPSAARPASPRPGRRWRSRSRSRAARTAAPPRRQHRLRPRGLGHRGHPRAREPADLRARVEARPVDVPVAAAVAHRDARLLRAREQRARAAPASTDPRRSSAARRGRRAASWNVHRRPSGSRLARKCRSSKTISEPSSTDGSTAPQTVTASTASRRAACSAAMLARWGTWLDSRMWPSPWREMCSTSTPPNVPRDTYASPHSRRRRPGRRALEARAARTSRSR